MHKWFFAYVLLVYSCYALNALSIFFVHSSMFLVYKTKWISICLGCVVS